MLSSERQTSHPYLNLIRTPTRILIKAPYFKAPCLLEAALPA